MSRRPFLCLAVVTLFVGVLSVFSATSASAGTGKPHITAHPNNLMVNTATELIGKNFQPSTTLTVKECGLKNWIVPQNPCDSTNSIVVTTNAQGGFKSSFTAQTCTTGSGQPGFSEKCYIGVPTPSGVDTITLVGAVRITVTGP
jgi:hypothetical protein